MQQDLSDNNLPHEQSIRSSVPYTDNLLSSSELPTLERALNKENSGNEVLDNPLTNASFSSRTALRAAHANEQENVSTQTGESSENGVDDKHPVVIAHLDKYPFQAPPQPEKRTAWFEGSFNPFTETHLQLLKTVQEMGFGRIVLGTVPSNPHKPPESILPFKDRLQILKQILKAENIRIVDSLSSREPGVFITESPLSFHTQRLRAWFSDKHHIVMGPDNFATYFNENRPWALFWAKHPIIRKLTRFQDLYRYVLGARLLVYETHHEVHATDVRSGRAKPHPASLEIWKKLSGRIQAPNRTE